MPSVTLLASAYNGSWAGGAWNTTTYTLLATADSNTNRIQTTVPNTGAKYEMATNRPPAASAVSAGQMGWQSWRDVAYSGACTFYLKNAAGATQGAAQGDGGPTSWTSGTYNYAINRDYAHEVQIWLNNSNDNPTDVRVSYIDYDMTYTPASAGGFIWLLASWVLWGCTVPGLLGSMGGGLDLGHMPAIRAELARQSFNTRRLLPEEDAAALHALKARTHPAYSFDRRA